MKELFRHISAIALSALVLFSTLSFTVGIHYCGQHLVDFAINKKAQGCGMSLAEPDSKPGPGHDQGFPCCEDVLLSFDGQEDLQQAVFELNLEPQIMVLAAPMLPEFRTIFCAYNNHTYKDYFPPPLPKDIPVLYQSFLI